MNFVKKSVSTNTDTSLSRCRDIGNTEMNQVIENKKDLADLAIWISEALECTDNISINWRIIKKFMDDFQSDHNLKIELNEVRKN